MYILKVTADFDSAHFLKGYRGKCSNIHGHRWKIVSEIFSETLCTDGQQRGMVVDFATVKKDLKKLTDEFDHTLIIEKNSLKEKTLSALLEENFKITQVDFRPTAECFAKFFFDEMKKFGYNVKKVTVYETENNCAVYEENTP